MPRGALISEASTRLLVPESHSVRGPGARTGPVFFNEQMAFNRDVSVMFLRAAPAGVSVADAMSATGSRAVRIANEVPGSRVTANDISPESVEFIEENIRLNGLDNCSASNLDMHALFSGESFEYVDLDPFGSPVPFIHSAIRGCRRKGILAITATDTAPLAGAHAPKCRRRYQCEPLRGYMCHEGGLRILMCNIARELAKFDRGMRPLLSFYADHYFRTYVRVEEGAEAADRSLSSLAYAGMDGATLERSLSPEPDAGHRLGPVWAGPLHDPGHLSRMSPEGMAEPKRCAKMLDLWMGELDSVFLYDMSELSSHTKMSPPKLEDLIDLLGMHGRASKTHVCPTSFKTDLGAADVVSLYREASMRANGGR
ncbi:MAG: tRNA (guanine(26)-N(2))-dimethyltransferase [Candidatus Methanoplasma sp.]|jgi:tRNA (guanine26-N2/guanine27-N2)-dimethyltransferase|nr:tRNA (guanine(26)-N(2))-dimethyltransferase [Candidatus Methanoplasma sp.]